MINATEEQRKKDFQVKNNQNFSIKKNNFIINI
jgi:hypothetical protein